MLEFLFSLIFTVIPMILFAGPLVLLAIFLVVYGQKQAQVAENNLAQFAQSLGLAFSTVPPYQGPLLQGTIQGIPVTLSETRRRRAGTGNQYKYVYTTTYQVHLNPQRTPQGLHVYHEIIPPTSNFVMLHEARDIKLLDPTFEEAFIVNSTFPDQADEIFKNPNIREIFLSMYQVIGKFYLKDNVLHLESNCQMIYEMPNIRSRLEALIYCAQVINDTSPLALNAQPNAPLPQPSDTSVENTNTSW